MLQRSLLTVAFAGSLLAPAVAQYTILQQDAKAPASQRDGYSITFEAGGKTVSVVIRGSILSAHVDGKIVSSLRLDKLAGAQRLTDDGRVLATVTKGSQPWPRRVVQERAELGVNVGELGDALAEHLGLDGSKCVIVLRANKGKPAAEAGVKEHDVITEIDGEGPVTRELLSKRIGTKKPGDKLTLRVLRRGEKKDIEVTLGKAEDVFENVYYGSGLYHTGYPGGTVARLPAQFDYNDWVRLSQPHLFGTWMAESGKTQRAAESGKAQGAAGDRAKSSAPQEADLAKEIAELRRELRRLQKLLDKAAKDK